MAEATETVTMEDVEDEDEMEINNNNNEVPANNNNNTEMKNNNYATSSSSVIGESSRSSCQQQQQQLPVNIQVTAKVLFGSVSAISALNAERKKKPGSPQ
jgi:hypothetical protein